MMVLWTELAKSQLKEAVHYYKEVGGNRIAASIKERILEKTKRLSRFPEIGQLEQNELIASLGYRYLVSGNYKIIYQVFKKKEVVLILAVFDARQHPDALKI